MNKKENNKHWLDDYFDILVFSEDEKPSTITTSYSKQEQLITQLLEAIVRYRKYDETMYSSRMQGIAQGMLYVCELYEIFPKEKINDLEKLLTKQKV